MLLNCVWTARPCWPETACRLVAHVKTSCTMEAELSRSKIIAIAGSIEIFTATKVRSGRVQARLGQRRTDFLEGSSPVKPRNLWAEYLPLYICPYDFRTCLCRTHRRPM